MVLGSILIAKELATKGRQLTLATLCRDAVEWATDTRDLLREIATDAEYLDGRITAVAADGTISGSEADELHALAREIRDEAITGRIAR